MLPLNATGAEIASSNFLWYLTEAPMRHSLRIFVALLVLTALMPTAWGRPNVICIEASGRVTYNCNDVVPDELNVRLAIPISLGSCLQDCGFCHDYMVGRTVTQSFHTLALPVVAIAVHESLFPHRVFMLRSQSRVVPLVDSSGSVSPLKC